MTENKMSLEQLKNTLDLKRKELVEVREVFERLPNLPENEYLERTKTTLRCDIKMLETDITRINEQILELSGLPHRTVNVHIQVYHVSKELNDLQKYELVQKLFENARGFKKIPTLYVKVNPFVHDIFIVSEEPLVKQEVDAISKYVNNENYKGRSFLWTGENLDSVMQPD